MGYNRYGWWNRLLGRSSVVGEDGWGSLCFVLFFFPGGRLTSVLWLFYCLLLHVVIITASVLKKRDGRKCVRMCFSTLDSDVAGVQSIPPSSSPAVKMLTDCYPLFFLFHHCSDSFCFSSCCSEPDQAPGLEQTSIMTIPMSSLKILGLLSFKKKKT